MSDQVDIRQRFYSSLQRGTGEAFLLLKAHPTVDVSDLILKGALTNYAYDTQCEGSRADYLYTLIQKSKQKDTIIKTVLTKLRSKKRDLYELDQICDLAVKFHQAGYPEAKAALYSRFGKNRLDGYEICGQGQVMAVGDVEGVLKVAGMIGQILLEDPDDSESSWRVDDFQKKHPILDIYAILKEAATSNDCIKAYYESILKNKWPAFSSPPQNGPKMDVRAGQRKDRTKYVQICIYRAG